MRTHKHEWLVPLLPYLSPTPGPDEDWHRDDADLLRRLLAARLGEVAWRRLEPRLARLGRAAPIDIDADARRADVHTPSLTSDGRIAYHESYHRLRAAAREHRVFTYGWHHDDHGIDDGAPGMRLAGFALGYLYGQAESGYYCPACMTDGAAFVLDRHAPPPLARRFVARLVQDEPEGAYEGAMFLTEAQGGSDVGATRTQAREAPDGTWRLSGDKWFASNADADVVLTLARIPDAPAGTRGLGLFVVPAHLDDGAPNPGLKRVRLKQKLGVRSMATAEVELRDAHAWLVEGAGRGFKAMAEMVNLSRLYNAVASVAVARRALREGQRNGSHREAFGVKLIELPLYARGLAELANDVRAALVIVFDTAYAFDRWSAGDESSHALLRALTPLVKSETARLSVDAASQACEMLGGNGYVEEWVTPRLLRDAQVLPIWEGTTHVQALDFIRACARDGAMQALLADSTRLLDEAKGQDALVAAVRGAWRELAHEMSGQMTDDEAQLRARRWVARAYALRAATLLLHDASDGDEAARAHAEAYVLRRVARDEAAFETRLVLRLRTLAAFG